MDPFLGVPPKEITRLVGKGVLIGMFRTAKVIYRFSTTPVKFQRDRYCVIPLM